MMLVDHVMETEIVGDHVLVEIPVVEVGADLRIVVPTRQRHPHRAQRIEGRQMRIRHLGKMPNVHSGSSGNDPAIRESPEPASGTRWAARGAGSVPPA